LRATGDWAAVDRARADAATDLMLDEAPVPPNQAPALLVA
jgi:hypothetical protein